MSNLAKLISMCDAAVVVTVNDHKTNYQTVADYLVDNYERLEGTEPEITQGMIDKDTVVELQFYPRTPVGFVFIMHYDVDLAIQAGIDHLESKQ